MAERRGELTALGGIAMLSTSLLGTGIFVVPLLGAMRIGDASLWAWAGLILLMLPIALVFGALGRQHPHAGGVSHWALKAFGKRTELVAAWLFLLVIPVGLPAAMLIALVFLKPWLGDDPTTALWVQWGILAVLYGLNRLRIRSSAAVQTAVAVAIVGLLAVLIGNQGLDAAALAPPSLSAPMLPGIASTMGLLIWCFLGIEVVAHLADEFKRPGDLQAVTILGMLGAGAIYYLCAATVVAFSAGHRLDEGSLLTMAGVALGDGALLVFSVVGFLACFASMNTYIAGFSRLICSLADEGKMPAALAGRASNGAPVRGLQATILLGGGALTVMHFGVLDLESLIGLANSNFILVYLIGMLAGVRLLRGPSKVIAVIAALLCLGLVVSLGSEALYGAATLTVGYALAAWLYRDPASAKAA